MRSRQLHDALEKLTKAIREVEAVVETMQAEHDPLASHIFVSRRHYRNVHDTKGGTRREMNARLSFNTACELGFGGSLDEWERLMSAVVRRWILRLGPETALEEASRRRSWESTVNASKFISSAQKAVA